ncbi:hypothetical protein KIPB_016608, partial [Kipferlia bialata]
LQLEYEYGSRDTSQVLLNLCLCLSLSLCLSVSLSLFPPFSAPQLWEHNPDLNCEHIVPQSFFDKQYV